MWLFMYRWILFLCHLSLTAPAPTPILSVMFLISSPCFLCVFYMLLPSPAVCWLEVFSPKARRCWTKNQLWTTDPQVTHPPAVMLNPPPTIVTVSVSFIHAQRAVCVSSDPCKYVSCLSRSCCCLWFDETNRRRRKIQMAPRSSRQETSSTQDAHCVLNSVIFNISHR